MRDTAGRAAAPAARCRKLSAGKFHRPPFRALHSITSSARASSVGGTSRPSILAVLRLMTSSNLRRLHDRQVRGLCALEDAAGIDAELTPRARNVGSVAHQPADFDILAPRVCRGDRVACRKLDQLDTPAGKVGATCAEEGVGPLAHNGREGRIDLVAGVGVEHLDLQPDSARSRFHIFQCGLGIRSISRIDEHGHTGGCGHQRAQEFQPFCQNLVAEKIYAGYIAPWPSEAYDKTKPDRVVANGEDDGDRRGCRLGRERHRGTFDRDDHGDPPANQFGRQRRQPIELSLGPAVFDRHVLALDIAALLQGLAKYAQIVRVRRVRRCGAEEPNHRHRRLLPARRQRPCGRCAAEQRDELAAGSHSITSSARASSVGGAVTPISFAVFRLMTSSNLVGCSTGNSAGFAPLNWLQSTPFRADGGRRR